LEIATNYRIELCNDRGVVAVPIESHFGFQYSKTVNGFGWVTINAPFIDPRYLSVDNIIRIWRQRPGFEYKLDFFGFLRRWSFATDTSGFDRVILSGPDQNDLMTRRIVAYAAGSAESTANGAVDDEMKAVIRENFGSLATDSDRDLSGLSFTIQTDQTAGTDIEKQFAWRDVDRVLADLNAASRTDGTEIFWFVNVVGIDYDGFPIMEFVTRTNQPGTDRSWEASNKPMLFGLHYGNLETPILEYDYSDERNFCYVGGQGEGSERQIVEIAEPGRINASIWNRREMFVDARNQETADQMTAAGYAKLSEKRPIVRFAGNILSTDQTPYGDWNLGDYVTIQYSTVEFTTIIRNVLVSVNAAGTETIRSQMEFEQVLG